MPIHPQESRQAHTEIGKDFLAAASPSPQPDSLARCDLRGSQPATGRGAVAGQQFPPIDLPGELLRRIYVAEGQPHRTPDDDDVPSWTVIFFWAAVAVFAGIFIFWLNAAASSGALL